MYLSYKLTGQMIVLSLFYKGSTKGQKGNNGPNISWLSKDGTLSQSRIDSLCGKRIFVTVQFRTAFRVSCILSLFLHQNQPTDSVQSPSKFQCNSSQKNE